jgi:hypothetical protein
MRKGGSRLLALLGGIAVGAMPAYEAEAALKREPIGTGAERALQALHDTIEAPTRLAGGDKPQKEKAKPAKAKKSNPEEEENDPFSQDAGTAWDDWMGESTLPGAHVPGEDVAPAAASSPY